jgi:hypothetical protein
MTVRAYLLVETAAGQDDRVLSSVGHGLQNCLALGHRFHDSELIVDLVCTDLEDLQRAIALDIPKKDGVTRVTPLVVTGEESG